MLEFTDDFFEEEVREDFLIDKTMKTVWAAELEVVQAIAEICDRHGLTWYAAFGTLLGAVRHEGYIPWDDDIDIMMKREDYMELLRVLPEELPEEFKIYSPLVDGSATRYHAVVSNGSEISINPERLERFHGCPFIVSIDIFPLDELPDNEKERAAQKSIFTTVRQIITFVEESEPTKENEDQLCQYLDVFEEICQTKIDRAPIRDKQWSKIIPALWDLANQIAMMYSGEGGKDLTVYINYMRYENCVFKREWFDGVVALPFEQFAVPAPNGYEEVLRTIYGDYNIRERGSLHDYPYYQNQLDIIRELLKKMEETYAD